MYQADVDVRKSRNPTQLQLLGKAKCRTSDEDEKD
jgi:hypothetical protein